MKIFKVISFNAKPQSLKAANQSVTPRTCSPQDYILFAPFCRSVFASKKNSFIEPTLLSYFQTNMKSVIRNSRYSDAVICAKQIKLLGLSGIYVQTLNENIPNNLHVLASNPKWSNSKIFQNVVCLRQR